MGADFIDYLIADDTVVPAGAEAHFDERIVRLRGSYQVNDRQRQLAASPAREDRGLPADGFVYCCFNAPQKISPAMLDEWTAILRAVPGSVLWLLDAGPSTPLKANLRREAGARGIAGERLVFAPRRPPEEYLAQYRLADLFLDTLPYNAHTTASDALWAGCPVLTCPGETFASRVAASLLRAAGLPELVAGSLDDYRARAVACGTGAMRDELTGLRARLDRDREHCALFDTAAFTRRIETAYRRMHERRARGEPPAGLRID
jgi:predicted O-linked N-acetylglucosamine transferase (SPINDLY family)